MMINLPSQKSRRNRQNHSRWIIWHESYSDSSPFDTEYPLTQVLIDEADLPEYMDSMNKSNISLVSLQKIMDIPASF